MTSSFTRLPEISLLTTFNSSLISYLRLLWRLLLKVNFDILKVNEGILSLSVEKGVTLATMLSEMTSEICKIDLADEIKAKIMIRMAEIEHRLSISCDEKIQLLSLIGMFIEIR